MSPTQRDRGSTLCCPGAAGGLASEEIKYAADSEIPENGDAIVVADAVSDAEAERLRRLLDAPG